MKNIVIALTLIMGFALAGCATPSVPYDRTSAGNINRIGLVTPKFPDDGSVVLATTVGQSFGLIGALVDAGMQANRDSAFNGILEEHNFDTRTRFIERVTEQLEGQGYTVVPVEMERDSMYFPESYPAAENIDAYLDIIVDGYGYMSAGIGGATPYRPSFTLRTKLTRASDNVVLMQDSVAYNPIMYNSYASANQTAVTVTADPAFEFSTFEALESDPPKVVNGLQDATLKTADALSGLMR